MVRTAFVYRDELRSTAELDAVWTVDALVVATTGYLYAGCG